MIALAADENFNNNITRGLLRQRPLLDLIRIQDVGLSGEDDPTVLEWTASENRILLTHDVATITLYAYERIEAKKPMPGVVEVSRFVPLRQAIEDILLLVDYSLIDEWQNQIIYLPL